VELLPLEPAVAVMAAHLGAFGGGPANHIIVATARHRKALLVAADERIGSWGLVTVIW